MFEDVATKYDMMNDVMSVGIHRIWKDIFMDRLSPTDNTKLLDVAGGTGDIAFRFLDYASNKQLKGCDVTLLDINGAMLDVGKERSRKLAHKPESIRWVSGDRIF